MDILVDVGDAPTLEPIDMYTTTKLQILITLAFTFVASPTIYVMYMCFSFTFVATIYANFTFATM